MTNPKIATRYAGGSRWYVHPETSERVPGVTSVLSTLPKPALKAWAAKLVAETAVERVAEVAALVAAGDTAGAVDFLKRAPDRSSRDAADFGTAAHGLLEELSLGNTVVLSRWPKEYHERLDKIAANFAEFQAEFSPEFLFREETVWSDTHGYAGSFDAMVTIDGETIVLDYKTGRSGVYPEAGLQMSAYRYADYILNPDGSRTDIPAIDGAGVLRITPDMWALHPVRADEEVFEVFLALRRFVFPWESGNKRSVVAKPINAGAQKRKARSVKGAS